MSAALELSVGDEVELDIGPVAHGGHCVARHEGRVVFVRFALPGERGTVRITEARPGSFCRGELVRVLRADPHRVDAPCRHFRPGGCGGCDFQHATGERQRELKAAVIAEQLHRLAGVDPDVVVEALPGDGFGWRSRVRWAAAASVLDRPGPGIGPRAARSHQVVGVDGAQPCLIAAPGMSEVAAGLTPPATANRGRGPGAQPDRRRDGGRSRRPVDPEVTLCAPGLPATGGGADGDVVAVWSGRPGPVVIETVGDRDFRVAADGFWQVHPAAAAALTAAVAEAVADVLPRGGLAWDLYGGVGLLTEVLCRAVGPTGEVVLVESDVRATGLAGENLARHPQAEVVTGRVEHVLDTLPGPPHAIVLDPPRSGAGREICRSLAELGPEVIVYVACDPAALGRDTATLAEAGYELTGLRAFDAFPQTQHVECVATFRPVGGRAAQ